MNLKQKIKLVKRGVDQKFWTKVEQTWNNLQNYGFSKRREGKSCLTQGGEGGDGEMAQIME